MQKGCIDQIRFSLLFVLLFLGFSFRTVCTNCDYDHEHDYDIVRSSSVVYFWERAEQDEDEDGDESRGFEDFEASVRASWSGLRRVLILKAHRVGNEKWENGEWRMENGDQTLNPES